MKKFLIFSALALIFSACGERPAEEGPKEAVKDYMDLLFNCKIEDIAKSVYFGASLEYKENMLKKTREECQDRNFRAAQKKKTLTDIYVTRQSADTATVKFTVKDGEYGRLKELNTVRIDGKWRVDLYHMDYSELVVK